MAALPILPAEITPYATGEQFSAHLRTQIVAAGPVLDRRAFLIEKARGRNIVHVGCLDHAPLVDRRIAEGQWLHLQLTNAAKRCVGLDIDAALARHVSSAHGIDNIICHDIEQGPPPGLDPGDWHAVLLPDVLEHIPAPVRFLASLRAAFPGIELVLTVPNAFAYDNFYRNLLGQEWVNSDHFAWYSPYTVCKTVIASGWRIRSLHFLEYGPRAPTTGVRSLVRNVLLDRRPSFADTIALVCADGGEASGTR